MLEHPFVGSMARAVFFVGGCSRRASFKCFSEVCESSTCAAMGKKKFIDKKKAATFQLFFRDSTDEAEGSSEKVFIRTDEGSNHVPGFSDDYVPKEGEADSSTPGPPHYFDEDFFPSRFNVKPSLPLTDEKRREIVEFGLQDDGYDYTQHLRTIGQARGLGVFIPASKVEPIVEENVKVC